MKIALPHGWFARILLSSWALLFIGTLVAFLLAFLGPDHLAEHLITSTWMLSIFVVLGTFAYAAAYAVRRLSHYLGWAWRRNASEAPVTLRPVEQILVAGWLLFLAAALGGLLFAREKWIVAFGPEGL